MLMGILDFLKTDKKEPAQEEPVSENVCSLCNTPGADKKYGGQYWHKKCLRKARKMAKSMI